MATVRDQALHWMRAQEASPWRWADGASVIIWRSDGTTVVFREELEFILEGLTSTGFPTLDAVVLALVAVGDPPDGGLGRLAEGLFRRPLGQLRRSQPALTRALEDLARLPPGLVRGSPARRRYIRTLFEGGRPRVAAGDAPEVLAMLRKTVTVEELEALTPGSGHPKLAFRELVEALERHPPGTLARRLRTGLKQPLGAPRRELVELLGKRPALVREGHAPANLLEALGRDRRFAGLARVTRRVLAASSVLRRLREPAEQPMGGFSDVSTRGSPDRLVLTELAHDADTFALRMVNGEALYLRRERPPRERVRESVVLLDTGIHLWGWPRIYGTAVALALRELRHREGRFRFFALDRGRFREHPLESIADVENVLSLLDPSPWPGPAAAVHLRAEVEPAAVGEWTLITRRHRDEEIEALRRELLATGLAEIQLATVARTGEFRLRTLNYAGGRDLAAASLDVAELLDAPPLPGGQRSSSPPPAPLLPAFLSTRPFPLPLAARARQGQGATLEDGSAVLLERDGTLLHHDSGTGLAAVLAEGLPDLVHPVFSRPREEGLYFVGRRPLPGAPVELFRVDPDKGGGWSRQPLEPRGRGLCRAVFFETAVVLIRRRCAFAYALEDGRRLARLELPGEREPGVGGPEREARPVIGFDGRRLSFLRPGAGTPPPEPGAGWTLPSAPSRSGHPVFRGARRLGRGEGGGLRLFAGDGPAKEVRVDSVAGRPRLRMEDRVEGPAGSRFRFEPLAPPAGFPRLQLARAVLPNGNAAILDRRGVLGLTFADPTLPEWAVLLGYGDTVAWRSDGHWFGGRGLPPGQPPAEAGAFGRALGQWWGDVR